MELDSEKVLYLYTNVSDEPSLPHGIGLVLYQKKAIPDTGYGCGEPTSTFESLDAIAYHKEQPATFAELALTWSRLRTDPWTYLVKAVI